MKTPFFYRAARLAGRVILTVYFRRMEVEGRENVPASGPVIVAANHPQSITDALVLGSGLDRMLHFLAHSGLFRKPLRAMLLRKAGVIPVYRPPDVEGSGEKNVEMFRACREALEQGEAIAIFPEGVSREERRLQKMRTGTARIALESEAKNGFQLGSLIVPVGISFESRTRFRSRVLLRMGQPIAPAEYADAYRRDPREAVLQLTGRLQRDLASLIVHLERSELDRLVSDVEGIYREELLDRSGLEIPGGSPFAKNVHLSQEIARAVEFYCDRDPGLVWRLQRLLVEYRRKRKRLRLSDEFLRRSTGPTLRGELARLGALTPLGLPVAAYGALWNFVPYKLAGRVARRLAADDTRIHFYQLSAGAVLYLLY